MAEMSNPIIVEFPLRGEWNSPTTPGTAIPSHGTNMFGTRYAYDFIKVEWNKAGHPAYKGSFLEYLFWGKELNEYYSYGKEIYSPFDGVVVASVDGYKEFKRTNLFSDLSRGKKLLRNFDPKKDDIRLFAGNYVIIKNDEKVYAALCHIKTGSIKVSKGQKVKKGDFLGKVGHSGNSTGPHLHFQLMDNEDMLKAKGLPCAFEIYELFENGVWREVKNGVPKKNDRFRFNK